MRQASPKFQRSASVASSTSPSLSPGTTTIWDRNNNVVDYTRLSAWVPDYIQARSGKAESLDDEFTYKFDVRRELLNADWLHLAAKTG